MMVQMSSILRELMQFDYDIDDREIVRVFQLWKQLLENGDRFEIITGFIGIMHIFSNGGRYKEALEIQNEFDNFLKEHQPPDQFVRTLALNTRLNVLAHSQQFSEFWETVKTEQEHIRADHYRAMVKALVMEGKADLAISTYSAYIAMVEIELLFWKLNLSPMEFPNIFWIPKFVIDLFEQGDDILKQRCAEPILRMVDLYLETYALAVFPINEEYENFLDRLTQWLDIQQRPTECLKVSRVAMLLREQWLKRPSPGRSWMRQYPVNNPSQEP
ncbi:MAG: hypothetical protein KIT45_12385 [Fimbriimonadia bacterium]|nr:hypothetical protein [Fimbriimonadia bacterium]